MNIEDFDDGDCFEEEQSYIEDESSYDFNKIDEDVEYDIDDFGEMLVSENNRSSSASNSSSCAQYSNSSNQRKDKSCESLSFDYLGNSNSCNNNSNSNSNSNTNSSPTSIVANNVIINHPILNPKEKIDSFLLCFINGLKKCIERDIIGTR